MSPRSGHSPVAAHTHADVPLNGAVPPLAGYSARTVVR